MLCEYGCGQEAEYQLKNGKWCCCKSQNSCPINKKKIHDGILKSPKHTKELYKLRWENTSPEARKRMNWNKGLTKETDERVKKGGETIRKRIKLGLIKKSSGFALTQEKELERRRKISEKRIKTLETSPHIPWFTLSNGLRVQGTWEYNIGEILLKQGYILTRPKIKYDEIRTYTPDFCIANDIYIEVKGWLSNRDIKKYKKVMNDHPNIKIYLIEKIEYKKFIKGEIKLEQCRDLYDVIKNIDI